MREDGVAMEGTGGPPRQLYDRSRKRVAQGVGLLALGVVLGLWFLAGGGFNRVESPHARVIGTPDPTAEATGTWVVEGIAFVAAPDELPQGMTTLALEMPAGGVPHNVVLEGHGDGRPILQARAAGRYVTEVPLAAGTITYWCDVGGHRRAGMEGTVTIR